MIASRRATVLATLVALTAAGCGSSGSSGGNTPAAPVAVISQNSMIQKATPVCASRAAERAKLHAPASNLTARNLPSAASYFAALLSTWESQLAQLRALGQPDAGRPAFQATIGNEESLTAAYTDAEVEARAGQLRAYKGALNIASRLITAAKLAATSFGFASCAP